MCMYTCESFRLWVVQAPKALVVKLNMFSGHSLFYSSNMILNNNILIKSIIYLKKSQKCTGKYVITTGFN